MNHYEEVKRKLEAFGQAHLLQFYEELEKEQKEKLLEEIDSLDFEELAQIQLENSNQFGDFSHHLNCSEEATKLQIKNSNCSERIAKLQIENSNCSERTARLQIENSDCFEEKEKLILTPMEALDKSMLSKEEKEKYEAMGEEIIRQRKVAVCTMAGGQGSRLGHEGPKGTFMVPLQEPKSIFQIAAEHMVRSYEKYHVYLDWYIMTSEENDTVTKQYFAEHAYFGYDNRYIHFFKQGQLPLFNLQGKILLQSKFEIFKAANGNGGIFKALEDHAILKEMAQKEVEYFVTCNVDNILIKPIDALMLGVMKQKKAEIGIKSILKRDAKEPVGVCCLKNGKPTVVEYIDLPKELAEETLADGSLKFGEVHFGCNYLSRTLLEKIAKEKLPYHAAKKKNQFWDEKGNWISGEEVNSIKYEMFIFDGFEKAQNAIVFRTKREEEFAPIKYKEGEDSPMTASKMYEDYWKQNGKNNI